MIDQSVNNSIAPSLRRLLGIATQERITGAMLRPYRVKKFSPCPVCNGDSECLVIPQDAILHVYCTRTESPTIAPGGIKERAYYHRLRDDGRVIPFTPRQQQYKAPPQALPSIVDRALRLVIRAYPLTDAHIAKLVTRGYRREDITGVRPRFLFASLPADDAQRYQATLAALTDGLDAQILAGVPGFVVDRRRKDSTACFLPSARGTALIEMTCNVFGLITGFQYSPDDPAIDSKGKPIKRLHPRGASPAGRPHVANVANNGQIWHTEGIHKANLVAAHYASMATGAMGVGNMLRLPEMIEQLDPSRAMTHVIAIDADFAASSTEQRLAAMLAELGYHVQLARWDGAIAKGPDDAILADTPITLADYVPTVDHGRRTLTIHAWQQQQDERDQDAYLRAISMEYAERGRAFLIEHRESDAMPLPIVALPCGVSKSYEYGKLAHALPPLAYVHPRKDLADGIPTLADVRRIETAHEGNCPQAYQFHTLAAELGINTRPLHEHVDGVCMYTSQFRYDAPAIFQIAHVASQHLNRIHTDAKTHKPKDGFQGVIVDEYDVSSYLPCRSFDIDDLAAAGRRAPAESALDLLFRAVQAAIMDVAADRVNAPRKGRILPCMGREVFDAIDRRCAGQLAALLGVIAKDKEIDLSERPWISIDIYNDKPDDLLHWHKVTMPIVVNALREELSRWEKGENFNSRITIGPYRKSGWGIHITRPLRFSEGVGPMIVLDATPDKEIYSHLFDRSIELWRADVMPPADMQHVAVRTGKRYGKTALCNDTGSRDRAIAEARYLLAEHDPDGAIMAAGQVGIITFHGIKDAIGEALGIAPHHRGHFWGVRGSNAFNDCKVLLIIGTPQQRPDEVLRLAQAIYFDDETPIDPHAERDDEGHWRYRDPRLAHVNDYLIWAEVTQCAHRSRPLRHHERTVITMCNVASIGDLPVTTEIHEMPARLTSDGQSARAVTAERIQNAYTTLAAQGDAVTGAMLAQAAKIRLTVAIDWLRTHAPQRPAVPETAPPETIIPITPDVHVASQAADVAEQPYYWQRWERVSYFQRRGMSERDAIFAQMAEERAWVAHHGGTI